MALTPSHPRRARPARARVMLTAALLTSGLTATVALTVALPAGANTAATVQQKKARPGATTSATASASPTGTAPATATATPSPTQSASTSPTTPTTATTSATAEPSATPTATPPAQPGTPCSAEEAVAFEGSLYCPGQIVGVQSGTYGVPSRVVLQGVTVVDVSGPSVWIMGGPACPPDPDGQEPQYCAAIVATMEVDFTGSESMPAPETAIDLYGVTNAAGRIDPDGFITVSWCDPDTCP